MPRWPVLAISAALLLATGVRGEDEAPRIYKWVDENGIAHYTTDPSRIPEPLRERIRGLRGLRRSAPEARVAPAEEDAWVARDVPAEPPRVEEESVTSLELGVEARPERISLERQIAEVEAEIAREEERIKQLISEPRGEAGTLPTDPEFRAAARRLPDLQARLRQLRAELETGAGPPETPASP